MVLVTHAIIGTALAQRLGNLGAVFLIGFLSHYIFDMVPHWHYPSPRIVKAMHPSRMGKKTVSFSSDFFPEMARVALDLALGFALSFLFFKAEPVTIFIAATGAVLPDLLVGWARMWPRRALVLHDRFHRWVHSEIRLDDNHILGIGSQIGIIILSVFLFR